MPSLELETKDIVWLVDDVCSLEKVEDVLKPETVVAVLVASRLESDPSLFVDSMAADRPVGLKLWSVLTVRVSSGTRLGSNGAGDTARIGSDHFRGYCIVRRGRRCQI